MNQISKMVKDEKDINYEILKQIEQHAKEYEFASDKKEFLKNVGAYEQKLILLNSKDPYEVLCHMEELDLPATKLILSELNYDEIVRILALFTTEDKQKFYTTFSDLSLVNQFIAYDKKASEYMDDLTIDRKINLLNASDSETVLASSKVYDSISDTDKEIVTSNVQTSDGISSLSNAASYNETDLETNNKNNDTAIKEQLESLENKIENELKDEVIKNQEELVKEEKPELSDEKLQYIKNNFEKYLTTNPELKDIDINNPDFYASLSAELLDTIDLDFKNSQDKTIEVVNSIESELVDSNNEKSDALEEFQEAKEKNEKEVIQYLKEQLPVNTMEQKVEQKTL